MAALTALNEGHLIAVQVALSMPGCPCLRCMGIIRQEALDEEGRNYGAAGGKPQVVWPNGVLASIAVGLVVQILMPWLTNPINSTYLEYDSNLNTINESKRFARIKDRPYQHYLSNETGDPSFDVRLFLAEPDEVWQKVPADAAPRTSLLQRLRSWIIGS